MQKEGKDKSNNGANIANAKCSNSKRASRHEDLKKREETTMRMIMHSSICATFMNHVHRVSTDPVLSVGVYAVGGPPLPTQLAKAANEGLPKINIPPNAARRLTKRKQFVRRCMLDDKVQSSQLRRRSLMLYTCIICVFFNKSGKEGV